MTDRPVALLLTPSNAHSLKAAKLQQAKPRSEELVAAKVLIAKLAQMA